MQNVQSILVIDDHEVDFFLLKQLLENGDLQINEITNLPNLQFVYQQKDLLHPSVIFLALALPDRYGLSTLEEINQLFPYSPIIVLGNINDLEMARFALQAGAEDYLVKGEFDEHILSRSIQYSIERKKKEWALIESEQRLRTILNADPKCIKLLGPNCELYEVNQAGMNMMEIDNFEAVKGQSVLDVVAAPYRTSAAQLVLDAFDGKSGELEFEMITRKGSHRWCEISIVPYRNTDGQIIRALAVTRDITANKKNEEQLRRSEHIRELIMDSALDAIICVDRNEVIFTWNPQAEVIFGWKEEEAIGKKLSALVIPERYHRRHAAGFAGYLTTGKSIVLNNVMHLPGVRANGEEFMAELIIREIQSGEEVFLCTFVRDVTERLKSETELRHSNERFLRITSTTNDAIWEWDFKTNKLWANEMHQQLYGLTIHDPVPDAKEWEVRLHPEDRKSILRLQEDALSADTNVFISEYRFQTSSGYRYIFDRCYIERDRQGNPIRMLGSMMDVTTQKLADEMIKHSNERFELIARTTNDAIWETDLLTNVSWGNEMNQLLYGLTVEDQVPSFDEWGNHIHPDDRDKILKSLKATLNSDRHIWVTEYRFINGNGDIVDIFDRTYILRDEQGKPTRMMGSMVDITERKKAEKALQQSEEKYRTLVEQASDGIFIADYSGRFVIVNSAGSKLSQYSPEELAELTIYDLADQDELKANPFNFEALKSEKGVRSERKMRKKDGSTVNIEINAKFLSDGRFLAFIRDITERKKAEEEINNSYMAIRKLTSHLQNAREEERIHIAREIHDELGQQLTVLKMDVSWLNKKLKALDHPELVDKTDEIVHMLNDTVNSVRRISSDLRPGLLDDLGLAAAIEWHLIEFGKRSGIKTDFITTETSIAIPQHLATGLFRIYQESVTNVARHAAASEVVVELYVDETTAVLNITDNGKGFDVAAIGSKKTLGVLGMEERAVMMGGKFSLHPNPDRGMQVEVIVPLSEGNTIDVL